MTRIHFRFPRDYPLRPPNVQLKTTYGNTVRFNPNLYENGQVCLSILGTFSGNGFHRTKFFSAVAYDLSIGPSWSPVQTIFSTLLSIQSLMTENPYHNEPGFEKLDRESNNRDHVQGDVTDYNYCITHETLRVAVIEMLQDKSKDASEMPAILKNIMISHFKKNYQFYEGLILSNQKLDGEPMRDPFHSQRPMFFEYKQLLTKIVELKEKFSQIEVENTSVPVPSYTEIAEKTLSKKDENSVVDSAEDLNEFMEEMDNELDGSTLYESESDGDN